MTQHNKPQYNPKDHSQTPSSEKDIKDNKNNIEMIEKQDQAHAKKNKKKMLIIILVIVATVAVGSIVVYKAVIKSPSEMISSFVKASQKRKKVSTDVFLNRQAEQSFAIVYKIPPKSFKIKKTTVEDEKASVEVEWVSIDSNHEYEERVDTVIFTLQKEKRTWKLEGVKQGDVINFDFLFGI